MAQIFPEWTNHVPRKLLIGLIVTANVIIFEFGIISLQSTPMLGMHPNNRFPTLTKFTQKVRLGLPILIPRYGILSRLMYLLPKPV